jgi:hypothetical protein
MEEERLCAVRAEVDLYLSEVLELIVVVEIGTETDWSTNCSRRSCDDRQLHIKI